MTGPVAAVPGADDAHDGDPEPGTTAAAAPRVETPRQAFKLPAISAAAVVLSAWLAGALVAALPLALGL